MEVLIKLSDAIKTLKSMAVPLVRKLPSAQPEWLTDYSFEESCADCPAYDTENHRCPRFNQVIRRALKDANLEPCEDCISRQAAIEAIDRYYKDKRYITRSRTILSAICRDMKSTMDSLPSAQPEQRYTEEELRVFQHGISLSLLSKRSSQHWQYDEDTATEIKFLERLYEKVSADMRGAE